MNTKYTSNNDNSNNDVNNDNHDNNTPHPLPASARRAPTIWIHRVPAERKRGDKLNLQQTTTIYILASLLCASILYMWIQFGGNLYEELTRLARATAWFTQHVPSKQQVRTASAPTMARVMAQRSEQWADTALSKWMPRAACGNMVSCFCCRNARQRLPQKECFVHRHRYRSRPVPSTSWASWHSSWLRLGRYLIVFDPLTFVLDQWTHPWQMLSQ